MRLLGEGPGAAALPGLLPWVGLRLWGEKGLSRPALRRGELPHVSSEPLPAARAALVSALEPQSSESSCVLRQSGWCLLHGWLWMGASGKLSSQPACDWLQVQTQGLPQIPRVWPESSTAAHWGLAVSG